MVTQNHGLLFPSFESNCTEKEIESWRKCCIKDIVPIATKLVDDLPRKKCSSSEVHDAKKNSERRDACKQTSQNTMKKRVMFPISSIKYIYALISESTRITKSSNQTSISSQNCFHRNLLAAEVAVKLSFDLFHDGHEKNYRAVAGFVPTLLIGLEKYQLAYDLLKSWHLKGWGGRPQHFLCKRKIQLETFEEGMDVIEPITNLPLNSKASDPLLVLDMALLKFHIWKMVVDNRKNSTNKSHKNTSIEKGISLYNMKRNSSWTPKGAPALERQCIELLKWVHSINSGLLSNIVQTYEKKTIASLPLRIRSSYVGWHSNEQAMDILAAIADDVTKNDRVLALRSI